MPRDAAREVPLTPALAGAVFGPRLVLAEEYVRLLADTGIEHGLLGPREAPRLWDRHVMNCAVIAPGFAPDSDVLDVGSGAGFPGLVLAIARPDLRIGLIEPLQRRARWLQRTIGDLALSNVVLHNGRADSLWGKIRARHATARAVAPLGTLAMWCLPLLEAGGSLLALKGENVAAELSADRRDIERLGGRRLRIESYGLGLVDPPALAVRIEVDEAVQPPRSLFKSQAHRNARRRSSGKR